MKDFQEAWPWLTRVVMWSNGLRREGYAPGSKWVVRWQRDAIRSDQQAVALTVESCMERQQERKKSCKERVQRLKKEASECEKMEASEGRERLKKKIHSQMVSAKTKLSWYRGKPTTATGFLSPTTGSVRANILV